MMKNESEPGLKIPTSLPEGWQPTGPEGLTDAECEERIRAGLGNTVPDDGERSPLSILRSHVLTLFNLLNALIAAALISVRAYRNLTFLLVVLSNTLIGTIQELRTWRALKKMQLMSEGSISVLRNGKWLSLFSRELVEGDVIRLKSGEQVPADAVVIDGHGAANESMLTGESRAVFKEKGQWLLSGSYLSEGSFTAQIVHAGERSYINRLRKSARNITPPRSRLLTDMKKLVRFSSFLLVPVGILLFLKQYYILHVSIEDAVTKSAASMLGMLPEGLILLTSTALMAGVIKLSRHKAMVRDLYSIESLARVDVLCLDKTGTLTSGDMTLQEIVPLDGTDSEIRSSLSRFLGAVDISSPTLTAISLQVPPSDEKPLDILPFSSERKYSAAAFRDGTVIAAGAPSFLLGSLYTDDIRRLCSGYASQGCRMVCAVRCHGRIEDRKIPPIEKLLCLCVIRDRIREGCEETLKYFRQQDVTLKVISGDDPGTVSAIAARVGIPGAENCADVSLLSDDTPPEEIRALVRENTVFGRVTPQGKCLLVEALKAEGHTVAMTGDGVNDIPALKASDCSIAVGGSDAVRKAAQLSLLDSDFSTLPRVVGEGRRVINNIGRAAALFLVKTLFSFALSFLTLCLPVPYPFKPIQLTLISSLTVGTPSFFLAFEANNERVSGNFLKKVFMRAAPGAAAATVMCTIASLLSLGPWSADTSSTIAVIVTGVISLGMLFTVCTPLNRFRTLLISLLSLAFAAAVLFAGGLFYLTALDGMQKLSLAAMCLGGLLMIFLLSRFVFGKRAEGKSRA
ncbi:MAG: HAD-IC family P-type ATPase [Clostridia bacterium]|nr:HAD-IC family P-type ATPase [Clostridia bacterium]